MKILICDDEIQYVNPLQAHVQQYMDSRFINYEILAITSPKEILESETRFDLAFLDIQMEEIDGISLAKELKRRNRKIALFFVTNYDDYQDDAMVPIPADS